MAIKDARKERKAQKYNAGYQISTGQPKKEFIDVAVRHVELRQGILGLKVKVMQGVEIGMVANNKVMPDCVKILQPKDQDDRNEPHFVSNIQHEQQEGHARLRQDLGAKGPGRQKRA